MFSGKEEACLLDVKGRLAREVTVFGDVQQFLGLFNNRGSSGCANTVMVTGIAGDADCANDLAIG
jgi:hypothetical protein